MIHKIVLWPFKMIDGWLKRHYEKNQLSELIAIQKEQLLRDTIPDLQVIPVLIARPIAPLPNVPLVFITLENYGGKTTIIQGHFWITHSNDPAYQQEKQLSQIEMPKGKKEEFFFTIKIVPYGQIAQGHSILKFGYDLHFYGSNQQAEERKRAYRYDAFKDEFVIE